MKKKNKNFFDIVIVGAGISGLYCGYLLKKMKISEKIMILEKEKYVGGRVKLIGSKNEPFEVGAQYIPGDVVKILKKDGIFMKFKKIAEPSTILFFKNKKIVCNSGLITLLNLPVSIKDKILILKDFVKLILFGNISDTKINKFVSKSTIDLLKPFLIGLTLWSPIKFSTKYVLFLLKSLYDYAYCSPSMLVAYLNNFLKKEIKQNADVIKINDNGQYFDVIYKSENSIEKIRTKKIVFSIPTDELVNKFSNLLTKRKIKELRKIRYSSCIVVSIKVKKKLSYFAYFFDEPPIYSMINFSDRNIINLFLPGLACKNLKEKGTTTKRYITKILSSHKYLRKIIHENDIEKIIITRWDKCLPILNKNCKKNIYLLKENINNRIFFCGDYTDMPSMEGAIKSAIRVSHELM